MKILLLYCLLFLVQAVRGQDMRDHWILGDSMHLQFTDSGLVYLGQVPFKSQESAASISSVDGQLQLYAHESRVYNSEAEIIPGGDSLAGTSLITSSMQGVVIVPVNDKYFIINRIHIGIPNGALLYSIIHWDSIGNSYFIPASKRKVLLQDSLFAEQLQVVRHGNGVDWWIIGRKLINTIQKNSNAFLIFKLSGEDITLEYETEIGLEAHNWGELTASPDGSLLALASFSLGRLQLFDFDRCSGIVSNARVILNDSSSTYWGCAFSPDGSKLYISKNNREVLEQVDLSSEPFSVYTIFSANYGFDNSAGQLELGPDGKLYWIQYVQGSTFDSLPAMYLGVVHEPNKAGLSCNYDPYGVYFGGRVNRFSHALPNHPNYYLGPLVGSPCDTLSDPDTTTAIQPIHVAPAQPCFELRASGNGSITLNIDPSFLNSTIELYNSSGAQVYAGQVNTTNSMLGTANWTPGVYVARLRTLDGNCPVQKFVITP